MKSRSRLLRARWANSARILKMIWELKLMAQTDKKARVCQEVPSFWASKPTVRKEPLFDF